ncbi:unnamed protein product [Strongylus vulgaris]|uniref:Uncharacterized protein n=1 Tax=Strongylus vulgaris TaxID=40348 RepID=A0A3P7JL46_STRVU|nr:unnamed protein product [Strongylus vulgaris]
MACLHLSCRPQHCFHPFLFLASVVHDIGIEVRRRRLRGPGSLLVTSSRLVHPCNEHVSPSGSVAFLEDVLLREEPIPEFSVHLSSVLLVI